MEPAPDPEFAELHPIELNPYAPPAAQISAPAPVSLGDPETARRRHLGRENGVKLAGAFCYVGAIGLMLFALFVVLQKSERTDVNVAKQLGGLMGGMLFASIPIAVGNGLKALRTWARWTVIILAPLVALYCLLVGAAGLLNGALLGAGLLNGIFLLALPTGLFGAMAVYMMLALLLPGAATLFTPEYRTVVAATPHLKAWADGVIRAFSAVFLMVVAVMLVLILRKI